MGSFTYPVVPASDADISAISDLTGTGLLARTAANTWHLRDIDVSANLSITNPGGVLGNPSLDTIQDIQTTSTPQFARLGVGQAAHASLLGVFGDGTNYVSFAASAIAFVNSSAGATFTGPAGGTLAIVAGLSATNAIEVQDDSGNAMLAFDTANSLLKAQNWSAATSSIEEVLRISARTSGTPAIGYGSSLGFEVETVDSNYELVARIDAELTDVGSGTEAAKLVFKTMTGGAAATEVLQVSSTSGVVINDTGSANVDFRAESQNNANLVTLDASADALYFGDGGTTDYAKFDTQGALTFAGAARPVAELSFTMGSESNGVRLPLLEATPTVYPAEFGTYGIGNGEIGTADFDASTEEVIDISFRMPSNYSSGANVIVQLVWMANATSGNCVWGAKYSAVADGEQMNPSFGTATTGTFGTSATAYVRNTHSITLTAATNGQIDPEDWVTLRIYRDANNASDTLSVDARLIEATVQFVVES